MGLFKYLPPERIEVLQSLRLRYSQPAAFNDPFEAKPVYTDLAPSDEMAAAYPKRYENVLHELYRSMPPDFQMQYPFDAFASELDFIRPEIYAIFRTVDSSFMPQFAAMMHDTFGNKIGAFSMSEINNCQLMWSHYAKGHEGFVLEFDEAHTHFQPVRQGVEDLWQLHQVKYLGERPKTTVIEFDLQAMMLTKHISWAYEREWKHFQPLNRATKSIDCTPLPIYLFEFPGDSISRLILGARMPKETRDRALDHLANNAQLNHVEVFEAKLDDESYAVNIRPIS